jgi:hypothetical protein
VVLAFILLSSSAAFAQEPGLATKERRLKFAVDAMSSACSADLRAFCPSIAIGDGRGFFCLLAHESKLSSSCDYVLYKTIPEVLLLAENLRNVASQCSVDIAKHCGAEHQGAGRVAKCLIGNKDNLQPECAAALSSAAGERRQLP